MLNAIMVVGFMLTLLSQWSAAYAADIPNFDKRVSIAAREQPVHAFFNELFGEIGVPVKVDANVVGSVNGDFRGAARAIYKDVEKAFQLVMYYDRSTVFIYPANQVSRNIIPMSEQVGKRVLFNAKKMRLSDSMNNVEWSDMGLVVSGTDRYQKQIESYAQAIQQRTATKSVKQSVPQPEANEVIKVFKLKYAWADDTTIVSGGQELMVRGVASLLRTVVETGMVGVDTTDSNQRTHLPRTERGLRGQGLQAVGREGGSKAEGRGATASVNTSRDTHSMNSTRIVADPLNNAIIIRDRADRMRNYQELIESLDIEPQMVEIEATIIDMDTDRLRSLGIDWRYQKDGTSILFGSGADQLGLSQSAVSDGLNGFTQNVLNNKARFLSHVKALETQGAARIVSKPHVMTLANVEALLDTTSTFFIRVAGREEVDLFNVSVGTTMRVTPHVFANGERSQIKMKIDIIDGSQSQQTVDDIPVIEESTINTQAIINAGQSLLIGGLVREFKTTGVSKVPVLGDIPGLGALFRSNRKTSSRMERMFLITPRLNTQVSAGKRYSVPIISGNEGQIIESGAARLNPALAGLASRDAAFPIKPTLPGGQANIELSVSDNRRPVPGKVSESPPQNNRTRPLQQQPNRPTTNNQIVSQGSGAQSQHNAAAVANKQQASRAALDDQSGWQSVGSSTAKTVASDDNRIKKQVARVPATGEKLEFRPAANNKANADDWIALPESGTSKRSNSSVQVIKTGTGEQDGWTEIIQ